MCSTSFQRLFRMRFKFSVLIVSAAALTGLSACDPHQEIDLETSQYWQRVDSSSATYVRGPKAQQILNTDISRCVLELRELERLGAIKDAIPADKNGRILDPDQRAPDMGEWDTPERDDRLFAEHADYHDFDGCMLHKGWERIKYVPYEVSEEAKLNYLGSHIVHHSRYDSNGKRVEREREHDGGDFDNLNE